ncbi:protein of unknown function [Hyphomicrobium sp. 1Nfss2.1]
MHIRERAHAQAPTGGEVAARLFDPAASADHELTEQTGNSGDHQKPDEEPRDRAVVEAV